MLTGTPSKHIILSNIIIGNFLACLFSKFPSINWYTLYIEFILICGFALTASIFIFNKKIPLFYAIATTLLLFLGFFSWTIIKPQFTTLALFLTGTSLLLFTTSIKSIYKILLIVLLMSLSILIRKDAFYIFLLFCIPILFQHKNTPFFFRDFSITLSIISIFFFIAQWINNTDTTYRQQQTYKNVNALDIIAANPIKVDTQYLQKNHFSINDITLLQSWLVADSAYLSGNPIEQVAKNVKTSRNFTEVIMEIKKLIADERYLLLMYVVSIISVFFVNRKLRYITLLNALLAAFFFLYLIVFMRLPHRVSFPILSYLIFYNFYIVLNFSKNNYRLKIIFSVFLLLGIYKFYCVLQMRTLHNAYQQYYTACKNEINQHPTNLFIGAEAFPLESMDAWQSPANTYPEHYLILAGWYPCSPDFKKIMQLQRLTNLTIDLKQKNVVYFVTQNSDLQKAYMAVMQERYQLRCHFEEAQSFKYLKAKKLVFDN